MGSQSTCRSAEASLAGRLTAAVALCAVLGSTVGGAAATAGTSTAAPAASNVEPQLVLRWVPCTHADPTEFFSLSFDRGGTVTFSGRIGTRELGEREERYSTETVGQLRRAAEQLRRHQVSGEWRSWLCIEVVPDGDRSRAFRVESESRAGAGFSRELAEVVPLARWVCPARAGTGPQRLQEFCRAWYGDVAFRVSSSGCAGGYELFAYRDGTIHKILRDERITHEAYSNIRPRDIDRLLRMLPSMHFERTMWEICAGGSCGASRDAFLITRTEEARRFREALQEYAGFGVGRCRSEEPAQITIPYDVGIRYGARRS